MAKDFYYLKKGDLVNPLLSDEYMIIGCFYNPKINNIITISSKKVKFWNIFNGKLMKTYSNLMDSDSITNIKSNYNDVSFPHHRPSKYNPALRLPKSYMIL